MCALLVMAVYSTETNGRYEYTEQTLNNLLISVDWNRHRMIIIDNGSDGKTKSLLENYTCSTCKIITHSENIGTAKGVNEGIKQRGNGEYVIKLDNDISIGSKGWVDEMEEAIDREPSIGILGLKRKDLIQTQWHADPNFRSEGIMLPHESGQRWIWVERTNDVMGTCTMLNWRLLDAIGYYYQGSWLYGMDDTLMNLRAHLAGFSTCFLPHIDIEHLDRGDNAYTQEKQRSAGSIWGEYEVLHREYIDGIRGIYEDGGFNE